MNAERLHAVIRQLFADHERAGYANLLQTLENAYTQSVANPQPAHATAFDQALAALKTACASSPLNSLSPSRMDILDRIGAGDLYGQPLSDRVEKIFTESRTPSNAVQALQKIRTDANQLNSSAQTLRDVFTRLNVEAEEAPGDAAEVEVLLPVELVERNLGTFAKEADRLNRALADIGEAVAGDRPQLELRSVSSSGFEIYLKVDGVTAAGILAVVGYVVRLIKSILTTRKSQTELENQAAPEKIIHELREWEKKRIEDGLKEIREKLLANYPGTRERKHELENGLSISLKYIADRLDRGMDIDVTTGAPEPPAASPEEGEVPPAERSSADALKTIRESNHPILELERPAQPVLQIGFEDEQPSTSPAGKPKKR